MCIMWQATFTNERMICGTLAPFVQSCNPNRDLPLSFGRIEVRQQGAAMKGDSTHKVGYEGGWELHGWGTHEVVDTADPSTGEDGIVQSFRPLVFGYLQGSTLENVGTVGTMIAPRLTD